MLGPTSTPASSPLPTVIATAFLTNRLVNSSTTLRSTMARDVAVQRCPVEPNAALRTMPAASSRFASASTMVGFLPPISSCTRTCRAPHAAATLAPVASEPVNEMARMPGCSTTAAPASPAPCTRLRTPPGRPASCRASARRTAQSGASSDGLRTTALPAIMAGQAFQAGMATGKFQGVIAPTTPRGARSVWTNTRSRSEGTTRPNSREPSPP